jgi:hypothetical protein
VTQVCEAFGCTPSQAQIELDHDVGLVLSAMDLRNYANAKHIFDQAKSPADLPKGEIFTEVALNDVWIRQETAKARAQQAQDDAERGRHRSDPPTA